MLKKVADERIVTVSGTPDDWYILAEILRRIQLDSKLNVSEFRRAEWIVSIAKEITS